MSDLGDAFGYYEDGSSAWPTEDGGAIVFGADGQPVQAWDADGDEIDPGGYANLYAEGEGEYDPADAIRADLAELNGRIDAMNERSQQQLYLPAPRSNEAVVADLNAQRDHLEGVLGRQLTNRESREIAARAIAGVETGDDRPDLLQAAAELGDEGRSALFDLDSDNPNTAHEARVGYMTERLQEMGPDAPDPVTGEAPRRADSYDLDDHQGRVDAALDRMAGHDVDGLTYSASDYDDQE